MKRTDRKDFQKKAQMLHQTRAYWNRPVASISYGEERIRAVRGD